MDMVSETGAVTDINEIAAGVLPELSMEEATRIEGLSMEELMTELTGSLDEVNNIPTEVTDKFGLTPAFESLVSVISEIQNSGAISRTDAATVSKMTASLEGFEDTFKNLPLISYTEMPSKVNFNASMENFIANAARKVIEIIKRIIATVRDKVKSFFKNAGRDKIVLFKVKEANKKVSSSLKKDPPTFSNHVTVQSNALLQLIGDGGLLVPLMEAIRKACDATGQSLTESSVPAILEKIAVVYKMIAPDDAPAFTISTKVTEEHVSNFKLANAYLKKQANTPVNIDVPDPVKWKAVLIDKLDTALVKEFYSWTGSAGSSLNKQLAEIDSAVRTQVFINNFNHSGDNPEYTKAVNCNGMASLILEFNAVFRAIMMSNVSLIGTNV